MLLVYGSWNLDMFKLVDDEFAGRGLSERDPFMWTTNRAKLSIGC